MIYQIDFFSDWHCGTGTSSGADVDELCLKDKDGFPYVPGKTLKGLLKESAKYFVTFDKDNKNNWEKFITGCFGLQDDKQKKFRDSDSGQCFFSNAELSKNLKDKIEETEYLYRKVSSTSIDENGIAKEHSLRKKEVAVPLVLYAEISNIPDEYKDNMVKCLKFIKRIGTNRNRGLGRCRLSVIKEVKNV